MSSPRNSLARRTSGSGAAPTGSSPEPPVEAADESGFLALTPERARVLLLVAARPAAIMLTLAAALIMVALLTAGDGLAGASGAIAASWLGAHQVPLVIGKTALGLLPLLPTALLVWLTARECARAVEPGSSRADLGWLVGAALTGPLLVSAVCLAVAEDASGIIALQPPNTLAAFAWVIGVHLVGAAAGIASRDRNQVIARLRLPGWAVAGAYVAARTVLVLLAAATAVTVVSFLAHWSRIGESYQAAGNGWGVLGLTLLSLAYLPNVVLLAAGVLVGAGAQFGDASVGLFSVVGGPIPAVPVLAAVPSGPAAGWWAVLLLIPAAAGVLGGLDAARRSGDRATAPWATLTSAALATVLLTLLGAIAGGALGSFGRVGLELPAFAVVTFAWLAVPGYIGLLCARWLVLPGGAPHTGYDRDDYHDDEYDESDEYYDEYDDRDADDRYDGDYYDGDYYDDDDYADYDGPDLEVEVDGELVEEQTSIPARASGADPTPDIVDAEVVEADLPESDQVAGR